MSTPAAITIVGAGLAGLTLGIGLRQRGVPVRIIEAGRLPRHRTCGEFISGRGLDVLARLGLLERLRDCGARTAASAALAVNSRESGLRKLPAPALCISRHALDASLAEQFRERGGQLDEGQRWSGDSDTPGLVQATGRRPARQANGTHWLGMKAHARNVVLQADLEMHVSADGYVGLCRVENGRVNVCGLFRRRAGETVAPASRMEWLRGRPGSRIHARLADAEFVDESFCAVAGLSLRPERALHRAGVCLGDAITMIPPVTGNGMSMAFESAGFAIEPLEAWSRGSIPWTSARVEVAARCDRAFAGRLRWAQWFQRFLLSPAWQSALVTLAGSSNAFWRAAFRATR